MKPGNWTVESVPWNKLLVTAVRTKLGCVVFLYYKQLQNIHICCVALYLI